MAGMQKVTLETATDPQSFCGARGGGTGRGAGWLFPYEWLILDRLNNCVMVNLFILEGVVMGKWGGLGELA